MSYWVGISDDFLGVMLVAAVQANYRARYKKVLLYFGINKLFDNVGTDFIHQHCKDSMESFIKSCSDEGKKKEAIIFVDYLEQHMAVEKIPIGTRLLGITLSFFYALYPEAHLWDIKERFGLKNVAEHVNLNSEQSEELASIFVEIYNLHVRLMPLLKLKGIVAKPLR